jgi:D-methionine transport system permease protein
MINLVGYSAMAGLIGGGGLGQVAIQYGYHRFNTFIMVLTVVLLILLVQAIQLIGGYVSQTILKKRGKVIYD